MIKYRTKYDLTIEPVEVIKETAHFVIFNSEFYKREVREAKKTDYTNYFDSWEEAKDHLVDREKKKLEVARLQLQQAQGSYGNALGLKNPEAL